MITKMTDDYGRGGYGGAPQPAGQPQVPLCPRHPDRMAFVRCQRCERPTCQECQRPAPVGIQCADCVAQAQAAAPRVRQAARQAGRPVITFTLIGICVAVFVMNGALGGYLNSTFAYRPSLGESEPWLFLTAAFLHSGWPHLLMNMFALFLLGSALEPALKGWRYIALYLLAALGGSVAVLVFADAADPYSWSWPVVGASGAVFGLFGAYFVVLRRIGADTTGVLVLLGINLAYGFLVPMISWQAHVGGLLVGAILALAYTHRPHRRGGPQPSRTSLAVPATVIMTVALVAITVLRYSLV